MVKPRRFELPTPGLMATETRFELVSFFVECFALNYSDKSGALPSELRLHNDMLLSFILKFISNSISTNLIKNINLNKY